MNNDLKAKFDLILFAVLEDRRTQKVLRCRQCLRRHLLTLATDTNPFYSFIVIRFACKYQLDYETVYQWGKSYWIEMLTDRLDELNNEHLTAAKRMPIQDEEFELDDSCQRASTSDC